MDEPVPYRRDPPRAFHFGAAVLVGVAFVPWVILLVILLYLVPRFQDIFSQLQVEMPVPTRVILAFSDLLRTWWFVALPMLLALAVGLIVFAAIYGAERIRWIVVLVAVSFGLLGPGIGVVVIALFLPLTKMIQEMG